MSDTQHTAPILDALALMQKRGGARFGAPGHGSGAAASGDILKAIGRPAFAADLLTPKGLDDRTETLQALQRAHELAAKAWGADVCRFATGGSSQSLHTALAAVARPGDTVLVAQNAHKAEFAAGVFMGLKLVPVPVTIDADWDLEHGMAAAQLSAALDANPDARAALVVSPSYFGITSDIAALAAAAHARGVPLIVDAAWGAAHGFCDALPPGPVREGADIVVVSAHKTLAALGQGSAMFVSGPLVDHERFARAYELFETTSPSVPILASLDATRRQHALHGQRLWAGVVRLAERTRARLARISGVRVLGRETLDGDGAHDLDVTKVTLDVGALGISGYAADDWMNKHHKVAAGLSDHRHLLFVFSAGTKASEARQLVSAVRALSARARSHPHEFTPAPSMIPPLGTLDVEMAMPAPQAFAAETELVRWEDSAGRVAAESIAPTPPDVPRLIPGQRIKPAHVAWLLAQRAAGTFVLDPADPTERKLRVVREGAAIAR